MRLVLRLGGGALSAAVASLAVACAHGADAPVDLADGATDAGSEWRDATGWRDGSDGSSSAPPPPGDAGCGKTVVINEVQTAGASASDEFVEILNPGRCSVSLGGWKVLYRSKGDAPPPGALYTFPAGDALAAGARVLLAAGNLPGKGGTFTAGMAAGDGQVGLVDDSGQPVDGVAYGAVTSGTYLEKKAAPSPPSGGSIARKPDGVDTDDNSSDFTTTATPTPGAPN